MSLNLGRRRESGESTKETSNDDDECLDHQLLQNLADSIEKITTTGRPSLDEELMKSIKKICKISDAYVEHTYHLVITQLHMGHSEIRLSAFQVINELFNRSHHFRELLVTDMQEFMEYSVETDPDCPLPPPKPAAKNLKESALRAIQQWQNKYGKAYKKLTLGYNFLKFQKKINFENIEARSVVERRRIVERENRKQLAEQQKLIKILQKIQEKMPEMEQTLTQMENCFDLLLPRQSLPADVEPSDNEEGDEDEEGEEDDDIVIVDEANCNHGNSPASKSTISSCSPGTNKDICVVNSTSKDGTSDVLKDHTDDDVVVIKQETTTSNADNDVSNQQDNDVSIKRESGSGTSDTAETNIANDDVVKKESKAPLANPSEDSVMETEDVGTGSETTALRQHGLPSRDYNLTIRLNTDGVQMIETEDNQDILNNLDDHYKLISTRFLPEIALWMTTLGKTPQQQDKLKKCIDVKQALKAAIEKYRELLVNRNSSSTPSKLPCIPFDTESSDDDEEFEDVPDKEGYEPFIPEHLRAEYGLEPLASTSSSTTSKPSSSNKNTNSHRSSNPPSKKKIQAKRPAAQAGLVYSKNKEWHPLMETEHTMNDPASQAGTMAELIKKAKNIKPASPKSSGPSMDPKKQQTLSQAPVVPFGVDLEHWENPDDIQAPVVIRPDIDHLVWSSAFDDDEVVFESVKSSMQTRVMSYAGQFTPVKWKCRAPLPSGKLCDRMDRVKCPFHGKIIGRDKAGVATNPEELMKALRHQEQEHSGPSTSSPFDIGLQQDVEAALGLDLGSSNSEQSQSGKSKGRGKKKGKGKAKKYPNLTDIKKVKNTSRLRLERKIMNKNALSRVAHAMTRIDSKRLNDKFSNNFTSLG